MRWRYGDTNPVMAKPGDILIEIGDLVFVTDDFIVPTMDYGAGRIDSDDAAQILKEKFLGVSMQQSRPGDLQPIRIATTGVFEFECEHKAYELGDLMRPCTNQEMASTTDIKAAIARVARFDKTSSVLVDIVSTVMKGGVQ